MSFLARPPSYHSPRVWSWELQSRVSGGSKMQRALLKGSQVGKYAEMGASTFPPNFCCNSQGIWTSDLLITGLPCPNAAPPLPFPSCYHLLEATTSSCLFIICWSLYQLLRCGWILVHSSLQRSFIWLKSADVCFCSALCCCVQDHGSVASWPCLVRASSVWQTSSHLTTIYWSPVELMVDSVTAKQAQTTIPPPLCWQLVWGVYLPWHPLSKRWSISFVNPSHAAVFFSNRRGFANKPCFFILYLLLHYHKSWPLLC